MNWPLPQKKCHLRDVLGTVYSDLSYFSSAAMVNFTAEEVIYAELWKRNI